MSTPQKPRTENINPYDSIFDYESFYEDELESKKSDQARSKQLAKGSLMSEILKTLVESAGLAGGASINQRQPNNMVLKALDEYNMRDKEYRGNVNRFKLADVDSKIRAATYDVTHQRELERRTDAEERQEKGFEHSEKMEGIRSTQSEKMEGIRSANRLNEQRARDQGYVMRNASLGKTGTDKNKVLLYDPDKNEVQKIDKSRAIYFAQKKFNEIDRGEIVRNGALYNLYSKGGVKSEADAVVIINLFWDQMKNELLDSTPINKTRDDDSTQEAKPVEKSVHDKTDLSPEDEYWGKLNEYIKEVVEGDKDDAFKRRLLFVTLKKTGIYGSDEEINSAIDEYMKFSK